MKNFAPKSRRRPPVEIIDVRPTPGQAVCSECGAAYPLSTDPSDADWICPHCGPSFPLPTSSRRDDATRPTRRAHRSVFRRQLPLIALIVSFSLVSLFVLVLVRVSDWKQTGIQQSSLWQQSATEASPVSEAEASAALPGSDPDSSNPAERSVPTVAASEDPPPEAGDRPHDELAPPSTKSLLLTDLLRTPQPHLQQELQLDCQFVRSVEFDTDCRIRVPNGDMQQPSSRLELQDPRGEKVSQVFVATGSQAEQVVAWIQEGDWLEIKGTVVMRLDRPTRATVWGFLIREIQPAAKSTNRTGATRAAATAAHNS